jgi:hypothetical protein
MFHWENITLRKLEYVTESSISKNIKKISH